MPGPLRWTMRAAAPLLLLGRLIGGLLLLGGLVSAVVGLATLDWALVVGGVLQATVFGILLGLGGGRQQVVEAKGPSEAFVIRVSKRRLWRSATGWHRVLPFFRGDFVWNSVVRRRNEDPLGPVLVSETAVSERDAIAAAERLAVEIRRGDDLSIRTAVS